MPTSPDSFHSWKTPPKDWAEDQALRIATTVRMLRGKRSVQWLSDRTAELGYTVTRSVISDLELGRRRYVSTAELVILARALGVPPGYLLFPDLPDSPVEVLPQTPVASIEALMWFSGESSTQPSPTARSRAYTVHDNVLTAQVTHHVRLSRQQIALRQRFDALTETAEWLQSVPENKAAMTTVCTEIMEVRTQLDEIDAELETSQKVLSPTADGDRIGR